MTAPADPEKFARAVERACKQLRVAAELRAAATGPAREFVLEVADNAQAIAERTLAAHGLTPHAGHALPPPEATR